jgi:hypothetical protein
MLVPATLFRVKMLEMQVEPYSLPFIPIFACQPNHYELLHVFLVSENDSVLALGSGIDKEDP